MEAYALACSGAYSLNVLSLNKGSSFVAILSDLGRDICLGDACLRCAAASLLLALTMNHVTIQCSNACGHFVLAIDPC